MSPDEVKKIVSSFFLDAEVSTRDLTGTGDHFEVVVATPKFQGKSLIEQHQMVHQALDSALQSGRIHALQIRTAVPGVKAKRPPSSGDFNIIGS